MYGTYVFAAYARDEHRPALSMRSRHLSPFFYRETSRFGREPDSIAGPEIYRNGSVRDRRKK